MQEAAVQVEDSYGRGDHQEGQTATGEGPGRSLLVEPREHQALAAREAFLPL